MNPITTSHSKQSSPAGLVGIEPCLEQVFPDPETRISERLFYRLKAEGYIPYYKIGKCCRYDVAQVRAAIDRHFQRKAL